MSPLRFILHSLAYHLRIHVAVALGVMAATGVLTGALLVGDSVRGSLRDLTLDRLGKIDEVLVVNRFFREELAAELAATPEFNQHFGAALPAILMRGTLENTDDDRKARAGQVSVLGCPPEFWSLERRSAAVPVVPPGEDQVVLNQPLADELQVQMGDEVIVRVPRTSGVPEESALGRKTDTVTSRRVTVSAIIAAEGLGRFGLSPSQQLPRNAYLATATLQRMVQQRGRVNAIFVIGRATSLPQDPLPPSQEIEAQLQSWLRPSLDDYGLSLRRVAPRGKKPSDAEASYFNLTSDRMLLEQYVDAQAKRVFGPAGAQPTLTYLANYISAGDNDAAKIPYSTVTALDLAYRPPLGPFTLPAGATIKSLADGEILLNSWAADDLAKQGVELKPGDGIRLTFFEPETTHGETKERTVTLRLGGVVALTRTVAGNPVPLPTAANDPHVTPEVKGITDQDSINAWNPPFEFFPDRVRSRAPHDEDEKYWDDYRATPKAFVSLHTGRELWKSRFGQTTSIRIPASADVTEESMAARLQLDPVKMGFEFRPVKRQGLLAASGTTPFNMLFIGFSFFIIAAAVMLVAILFRLGCDQRAREVGILLATGLSRGKVLRLLTGEGLLVAALGGLAGVGLGVGYAWLMLAGLRSPDWWLDAVTTPFLQLHWTWESLIAGYASGVLVSLAAIAWAVWQMGRQSVRRLLADQVSEAAVALKPPRVSRWIARIALPLAVLLAFLATQLVGEAQAGAFFGSGALVLAACLAWLWGRLRRGATGPLVSIGGYPLARLAARNGARNPARSTLTIALVASATFLIVALSAFRMDPSNRPPQFHSGDGGFALVAQTDQPLYHDLNTKAGRSQLGIAPHQFETLDEARALSLRVQPGDDSSCLNLYQTNQPRILGLSETLVRRGGFAWAGTAATSPADRENPWLLLLKELPAGPGGERIVPVVLDLNTAMYSLHKGLGDDLILDDQSGGKIHAQIVGLLKNSIFQGDLLMSEADFIRYYPQVGGARMFLIEALPEHVATVESVLESALGDYGFDAQLSSKRLADFLAVQNTYLSTFQSLGGLGLLLGTFGLATVQLRSVLERRGELALMRAAGFRLRRLAGLVMLENALLLVTGLAVGVFAALVAIWPQLAGGGAEVPRGELAATLATVLLVGLLAGLAAVRAALRAPLLPALRGE